MPDFGRADAKGEGTKGTVGAGVAVSADDGHSGLRTSQFGTDDVHDAASRIAHAKKLDTEFSRVLFELPHLPGGGVDLDRYRTKNLFGLGGR